MPSLVLIVVVVAVSVVAHEGAHALAARVVGFRLFEIHIGAGPSYRRRVGETDIALAAVPIGGFVVSGGRPDERFVAKAVVVAVAGIVANMVMAGIGVLFGIRVLIVFNVIAALSNLWPGLRAGVGSVASDGRIVLDLLRRDERRLQDEQSTVWAVPAQRALRAGDLDRGASLTAEGIEAVGEARALVSIRAAIHFLRRDFSEAVRDYATLIDDEGVDVATRGRVAVDAAWAASLSDEVALRALALDWADFARRLDPRDGRRRLVYALALVDAQRPDDALSALPGPVADPSVAAVATLAHLAAGRIDEAQERYDRDVSGALDVDHPLHRRVLADFSAS